MSVHTISSRNSSRDVSAAKRAVAQGPVFITDRGRPAFALLRIEGYCRIAGHGEATLLSVMDGILRGKAIKFDPPRLDIQIRPAAFD